MEKTIIDVGTNYMDFVSKFHKTIRNQKIMLVYEGEITQTITKEFSSLTEQNLEGKTDSSRTQKRVYHVMVECLQNVAKHADKEMSEDSDASGRGIFMISNNEEEYTVTTGNVVSNEKAEIIKEMLDKFNALEADEIKSEYKRMIKASRLSEKAGAGLGFIDIVKKTGNNIEYFFDQINDETSFFIQKSVINRD
jgi:coenzyme F420-reducing hydrogenase delta subunit